MSYSCSTLSVNTDTCSTNYTPGRDLCSPMAFVLHAIPNFTIESYLNFTKNKYLLGKDYYTDYPKSVHYLISDSAIIYQLVELHDRAWGVSELDDPSWPLLNQCAWSDYEDLFIHIGFIGSEITSAQIEAVSQLMCCVILDNNNTISVGCDSYGIIVARDLNVTLDHLWDVPDNVLAKTQVCVDNNGEDPYYFDNLAGLDPRVTSLEDWRCTVDPRLTQLEACCCTNAAAISEIETQVSEIAEEVTAINVDDLEQRIAAIEEGNFAIWKAIRVIQNCLECASICTPETPTSIHYRLDLTSTVKLVPGVIQHLNLPIKIRDVDPPIVTTGPLWYAEFLEEAQSLCTTFKVKASVRLSSATWCAGKTLELYAIINSENILINKYTAEAGTQAAAVYGETIFTVPPDSVVYLGVKTDEDTVPLEILMADIQIECLDGLISPNCVECDTV